MWSVGLQSKPLTPRPGTCTLVVGSMLVCLQCTQHDSQRVHFLEREAKAPDLILWLLHNAIVWDALLSSSSYACMDLQHTSSYINYTLHFKRDEHFSSCGQSCDCEGETVVHCVESTARYSAYTNNLRLKDNTQFLRFKTIIKKLRRS